jgi:YHS domain-containing protein
MLRHYFPMKIHLLTKLVPATFVAAGLFIGCGGDHDHDGHDHNGDGKDKTSSAGGGDYALTTCLVSGEDLESMGGAFIHKHEGVTVKFCCEGCVEDFEKDPEKFIAKLDAAKNGQLPKPAKEKPETEPENTEKNNSEIEKPAETKPKDSEGEGKTPAGQGGGEKK